MPSQTAVFSLGVILPLALLAGVAGARAAEVPADSPAGRLGAAGLTIERSSPTEIILRWGDSCLATDFDYAVYEGVLGNYGSHAIERCSTGGATEQLLPMATTDVYYLIVPRNADREGSYGTDGAESERLPPASACLAQEIGPCPASVPLADLDASGYRWMDVADQVYAASYRGDYDYTTAQVLVQFFPGETTFRGIIRARGLKPNFTYQVKLAGNSGTASNEAIGLTGRWWQEEWNGSAWANGRNLNDKGDGSSPNPNDQTYFARRDVPDSSSPTGLRYRFTGYLVFEYFITDAQGDALLTFEAHSSYHVLWKTSQRAHTAQDGPVNSVTFDVELPDPVSAYDVDYPETTVGVFGEWERLPVGGVTLPPGFYDAQLVVTEESFHGSGLAGAWAAAMGASIVFDVAAPPD